MGDRGNIVIKQRENQHIFFYTHHSGSDMPNILQKALKRGRECWTDEQYLARIIFCEMVKDDVLGTDSYGMSTFIGDNDPGNDLLVVDIDEQKVSRVHGEDPTKEPENSWSFEQFLKLNINKEFGYAD